MASWVNQLNLKIPQDIAIIAFDDHHVFDVYSPTITAVAQPIDELAKQLINVLLDKLDPKKSVRISQGIVVSAELIVRDSTER